MMGFGKEKPKGDSMMKIDRCLLEMPPALSGCAPSLIKLEFLWSRPRGNIPLLKFELQQRIGSHDRQNSEFGMATSHLWTDY